MFVSVEGSENYSETKIQRKIEILFPSGLLKIEFEFFAHSYYQFNLHLSSYQNIWEKHLIVLRIKIVLFSKIDFDSSLF